MSEKALRILSKTSYRKGLIGGVPAEVVVSHKFGERQYLETGEKQLHDCGIVYSPDKPYLLCIMTRGSKFESEAEVIRKISAAVYQEVSH